MARMPRMVDLGFFRRAGACAEGVIGRLRARFDRHRGGVATVQSSSASAGPVAVAARLRVRASGRTVLLRQEDDPDPRLIVCEQGPERIWMRVMFSLLEPDGTYHGDGLAETICYADGEARLAFGLRLVGAAAHEKVTDAWIETRLDGAVAGGTVGAKRQAELDLGAPKGYSFRRQLAKRYVAVAGRRGGMAFGFASLDGRAYDTLGKGVGLWHSDHPDRAPWYDTWGHLYDQWNGHSGWGAFDSGRLMVEPETHVQRETDDPGSRLGSGPGRGVSLNWKWLHEADEPAGELFGLRALLGLYFDRDADSALKRLRGSFRPVLPKAEEAQFRCLDRVENVLLYRRTGSMAGLTFPQDKAEPVVRVRLSGYTGKTAVSVTVNGKTTAPQQLSAGGMTDDPYGPNLARPGDRHVPLVGDVLQSGGEVVTSLSLSAKAATEVRIDERPGVGLTYLKWDDRQLYAVHDSSVSGHWPVATFSVLTLCLHNLRAGEEPEQRVDGGDPRRRQRLPQPAVVRLPLYWYPTNVQTPGHCVNQPQRLRVRPDIHRGPALEVTSTSPGRRLRSTVTAAIPLNTRDGSVRVNVSARLAALDRWDLGEMQFLNLFPYNSWRTADWETDWIVTLDGDGNETTCFVKEPRGQSVLGDQKQHWRRAFFLAQGARDRGNIFLLVHMPRDRAGARQIGRYVLCRCWLDSHLSLDGLKLTTGDALAVDYALAIRGDRRLSRAEALAVGRRALRSGAPTFD